jgi:hypothetical protein
VTVVCAAPDPWAGHASEILALDKAAARLRAIATTIDTTDHALAREVVAIAGLIETAADRAQEVEDLRAALALLRRSS